MTLDDIEWHPEGITLTLHHSKTNQTGRIETKRLMRAPVGHAYCPVAMLDCWLESSGITRGAISRAVSRQGNLGAGRMSAQNVYVRMKQALEKAGLTAQGFTPHSFRAGFITEVHLRGKSDVQIKRNRSYNTRCRFQVGATSVAISGVIQAGLTGLVLHPHGGVPGSIPTMVFQVGRKIVEAGPGNYNRLS